MIVFEITVIIPGPIRDSGVDPPTGGSPAKISVVKPTKSQVTSPCHHHLIFSKLAQFSHPRCERAPGVTGTARYVAYCILCERRP
jgi:hypothetical protein